MLGWQGSLHHDGYGTMRHGRGPVIGNQAQCLRGPMISFTSGVCTGARTCCSGRVRQAKVTRFVTEIYNWGLLMDMVAQRNRVETQYTRQCWESPRLRSLL